MQAVTEKFTIESSDFGTLANGQSATLFTLKNTNGMQVAICDFGGIIVSLHCPDKNGQSADVVLGFDSVAPYETQSPYFGALIGRVGNRLAHGRFTLDYKDYQLAKNENGKHHLHGGERGFDKVLWDATAVITAAGAELHLAYISADGDQGYPGQLDVKVIYRLTDDNRLQVEYTATTDKPTLVNLTQHSYFNLAASDDILTHQLTLDASHYTPIDQGLIPTGDIAPVSDTVFDFRQGKAIGDSINEQAEQLLYAGGFDHNFVLDKPLGDPYARAAEVIEPVSGRVLTLHTSEPGVQFYSGNFLDGSLYGKGRCFTRRSGFCLEPQKFPDAPNQKDFPSIVLRPGEQYQSSMCFSFSVIS